MSQRNISKLSFEQAISSVKKRQVNRKSRLKILWKKDRPGIRSQYVQGSEEKMIIQSMARAQMCN